MYYNAAVILYGDTPPEIQLNKVQKRSINTAVLGQKKSPNVTQINITDEEVSFDSHWLTNQPLFVFTGRNKMVIAHELSVIFSLAQTELVPSREALRSFLVHGPMSINFCPFDNVATIMPGDRTAISLQTQKLSISKQTRPPGVALDTNEIGPQLCHCIGNLVDGRDVALAISGGIDSTLIASLYRQMNPDKKIVGFTADTGAGNDLLFASKVAEKLDIKLIKVSVPEDADALILHRAMTASSLSPMPLTGNAIGFAAICRTARSMGFDAILDGSGGDQFFGGNSHIHGRYWALDKRQEGHVDRVQHFLDWIDSNNLVSTKNIKLMTEGKLTFDFTEKMYEETTRAHAFQWIYQHCANAKAQGIDILMPFFDEKIANFILNDLDHFFIDGISKVPLRRLLERSVGREIAYRKDNQGLRWPVRRLLETCRPEIRQAIRNCSFGSSFLMPMESKLISNMMLGKGRFARLYGLAVLTEMIAEPPKSD